MLLAFGSLLTQVQPVEPLLPAKHCACGAECGGQCGMPDCALPATPSLPQFALDRATALVRPTARRDALLGERPVNRYIAVPLASLNALPACRATVRLAPAASVPLFREHCSLLI